MDSSNVNQIDDPAPVALGVPERPAIADCGFWQEQVYEDGDDAADDDLSSLEPQKHCDHPALGSPDRSIEEEDADEPEELRSDPDFQRAWCDVGPVFRKYLDSMRRLQTVNTSDFPYVLRLVIGRLSPELSC